MSESGTKKYSVTIPEDLATMVQARVGKGGFSAYVAAAVARQVERDNLREIIEAAEAQNGPADPAEVEAKRALLSSALHRDSHTTAA